MQKVYSWLYFFICLFLLLFFPLQVQAQVQLNFIQPPLPCDFYGVEESAGALIAGQVITAQDPQGVAIGQFTVTDNGQYGFLTCIGDVSGTVPDEGAVDGDIITFYINGVKQRQQAVWKSGEAIQVDLGVPVESGAFSLHILEVPDYASHNNDPAYSGVAVADMILDYLDAANSDTQADLMSYADLNGDQKIQSSENERLLNWKSPSVYHFGSSASIGRYAQWGIIDQFDPASQSDVIKQACHWLAYEVPGAPQDKEYVPVVVATSANPATAADSDYQHWMSLVGIKTNQDPFPSLSDFASFREVYQVPDSIQLYGVYLNDPGQSGLGFHTYVAASVFTDQYFRPIASGLEAEGTYVAIMEPPDPEAVAITIQPAEHNTDLEVILETPQTAVSFFIPGWVNPQVKDYLLGILEQLKDSFDFADLLEDTYFKAALAGVEVNRCFKVAHTAGDNYTIIPFEREIDGELATTVAVMVNNATGQFQLAFGDPQAASTFEPLAWPEAYTALRQEVGWVDQYPLNRFLSYRQGSPLYPGWNVVTLGYSRQQSVLMANSFEYTITPDQAVEQISVSPQVEVLSRGFFSSQGSWVKIIVCEVEHTENYTVAIDQKSNGAQAYLYNNADRWLIVLRGPENASARIKVAAGSSSGNIRQGGVTYVYVRK